MVGQQAYENGRLVIIEVKADQVRMLSRWEFRGQTQRGEAIAYEDAGEWYALGQVTEEGTGFSETPRLVAARSRHEAIKFASKMVTWADISVHGVNLGI